ncbi:MAG: hypothetical protein AAFV25_24735 [Bacteroidota bacterium]
MVLMHDNQLKEQEYDRVFDEEFYPHADALFNFAYNLTYNEEDANDLVQETYMKVKLLIKDSIVFLLF